jgi:hypothetical protein
MLKEKPTYFTSIHFTLIYFTHHYAGVANSCKYFELLLND